MNRIIDTIAIIWLVGLYALILVEWFAGCGELVHYADGTTRIAECVFL